jgi:hypothetical protein
MCVELPPPLVALFASSTLSAFNRLSSSFGWLEHGSYPPHFTLVKHTVQPFKHTRIFSISLVWITKAFNLEWLLNL